jgi:hypothetical protein
VASRKSREDELDIKERKVFKELTMNKNRELEQGIEEENELH